MSNNDLDNEKTVVTEPVDAAFDAVDSDAPEAEADPEPKAERKTRTGYCVAWLAVIIALAAFTLVAWQSFQSWRSADNVVVDQSAQQALQATSALATRIDAASDQIESLSQKMESNTPEDFTDEIATIRREIGEKGALTESLPSRMSALEESVAALAGISVSARATFLLREAEYYLQIANAQLQLANNPELAAEALAMADERVAQIADPGLIDVRRALADERAALEVMEKPDLAGMALTLASLARVVDSLPLAGKDDRSESAPDDDNDERGTTARAWDSMKSAMSELVKVTPPDRAKMALLSPDAEYFLRNNIAMQLQASRLALLRGEQAIFEQSLDDTSALLETYFDNDSTQVMSALETIAEVRNGSITLAAPDISRSLSLLRQFRTLSEARE